ncbi:MAG: PEP-CTERM sorting domain-containing protein [Methylophilaceae bacterium]|nr:PEP-CTERM sorting domain-containing protein [Methylophilaceae bacterium]
MPEPEPEPTTYEMMIAGLGLLGSVARSRRNPR